MRLDAGAFIWKNDSGTVGAKGEASEKFGS
jgi:hypothetical protein